MTDYAASLELLRWSCGDSVLDQVEKLRAAAVATAYSDAKVAGMPKDGDKIVRPWKGRAEAFPRATAPRMHYIALDHAIDREAAGAATIVEIGCGDGSWLARTRIGDTTSTYIATDVDPTALACARSLGLDTHYLDVAMPDFEFLRGLRDVLIVSHFACAYAHPFYPCFWEALRTVCPEFRALMFEPISYMLPRWMVREPLFTEERARIYNLSDTFWESTCRAAELGVISIDEVKPDYCGMSMLSAVTMLKIRSLP